MPADIKPEAENKNSQTDTHSFADAGLWVSSFT